VIRFNYRFKINTWLALVLLLFVFACIRPLSGPSRPVLISPEELAVLYSPEINFKWNNNGAVLYVIQVTGDAKFRSVIVEDTVDAPEAVVFLKTDGNYWWRVKGQSEEGLWGDWSEPRSFILQRFVLVNKTNTTGYPHDIAIHANYAYVADGQAGLAVFQVEQPGQPIFISRIMDSLNVAWGVEVKDSLVLVAYGYKELFIVNARNPENLKIMGILEYPQPGYGYDLAVLDSWAFIAAGAQFIAIDISQPSYPNLRFQYYYPRNCRDIVIKENHCFLACEQLGVTSWRVDTFPPIQVGAFDTEGSSRGVAVRDNLLFVADGRNGLVIVNVAVPENMSSLATVNLPGYANSVTVDDTLVLVACGSEGLAIVNCVQPEQPYMVAQIATPYAYATGVSDDGKYYLICDRDWGIVTIRKEF